MKLPESFIQLVLLLVGHFLPALICCDTGTKSMEKVARFVEPKPARLGKSQYSELIECILGVAPLAACSRRFWQDANLLPVPDG